MFKNLPIFGEFDAEGCASVVEYFNPGGLRKKTILKDFREKRKILKNRNTRNGSFEILRIGEEKPSGFSVKNLLIFL